MSLPKHAHVAGASDITIHHPPEALATRVHDETRILLRLELQYVSKTWNRKEKTCDDIPGM